MQALADAAGVSTLNTRLSKQSAHLLTLHIASESEALPDSYPAALVSSNLGFTVKLVGGDYAKSMQKVNASLREAAKFAGDKNRAGMLADYERSFRSGDIEAHKVGHWLALHCGAYLTLCSAQDGSRKWVKDQGPVVENYIGFIEVRRFSDCGLSHS